MDRSRAMNSLDVPLHALDPVELRFADPCGLDFVAQSPSRRTDRAAFRRAEGPRGPNAG